MYNFTSKYECIIYYSGGLCFLVYVPLLFPTLCYNFFPGTKKFDACSHIRAYEYYMESIAKPQGFVGFPCSDKDNFAAVSQLKILLP